MRHLYILSILFLAFVSCNRDDSTGITHSVSEITIEDETEELNVDFGFELIRKVPVTQTMEKMPLSYEWATAIYSSETVSDTLKVISEEEELHHIFRERGKHRLRLKVSNEHGAVFKEYIVWVNAAFEEGIMMLAENENGEGNLSFLKTLTPEEIESGVKEKILEHCFSTVNPGINMKNPAGCIKIPGDDWFGKPSKFIMAVSDKIYFADPSTLEIIGTAPIDGEYHGEKAKLLVAANSSGFTPFILTENEKIIHIDKDSYFLFNHPTSPLYQNANNGLYEGLILQYGIAWGSAEVIPFFINYTNSTIEAPGTNVPICKSFDLLKDEDIITVYKENSGTENRRYFISSSKTNPQQIIIHQIIAEEVYVTQLGTFKDVGTSFTYELSSGDKCPARGTQLVGCATYAMALWNEGSEIYAWNYLNPEPKFPNTPVIDVKNADNAGNNVEITYMATSNVLSSYTTPGNIDKWLYVGVYDKDTKRGSLYIYECAKIGQPGLKPYKQFDNQTDRIKFIMDKTR